MQLDHHLARMDTAPAAGKAFYRHSSGQITDHLIWSDDVPVVVIDPEEAEQIERLADLYAERNGLKTPATATPPHIVAAMQDALREFARPTPPKCGAVLNIAGEHYRCDGDANHDEPHTNQAAAAIWGERQ